MKKQFFCCLSFALLSFFSMFASQESSYLNSSEKCRCERSPRGNTGATGVQGIPGEPGAIGSTGTTGATGPVGPLSTGSYAYIFNNFSGSVTPTTDSLLKGGTAQNTADFTFNSMSGDLTVNTSGLYEITYGASATTFSIIGIAVNFSFASNAPAIIVDGANSQSMVTSSFITNLSSGDQLRLRSASGIDLFSTEGTASAYLQVLKLE